MVVLVPHPDEAGAAAAGCPDAGQRLVSYRDGRVTICVREADRRQVLEEIATQAGASVRGLVADGSPITVAIVSEGAAVGLARLLGAQGFALRIGTDGRLRCIELGARPVAEAPQDQVSLRTLWAYPVPVPRGAAFMELRRPTVQLEELAQLVATTDDEGLRAAALDAVFAAAARDPAFGRALGNAVLSADFAGLTEAIRVVSGERARDVLLGVMARSHDAHLRARAGAALRTLRRGD